MAIVEKDGKLYELPDDISQDEIPSAITRMEYTQKPSLMNMAKLLLNGANTVRQQMQPQENTNTLPQISGGNVAFLGRQGTSELLASTQRAKETSLVAKAKERASIAASIEAEKERKAKIDLEDMKFKNDQKEAEIKARNDLNLANEKAANEIIVANDTGLTDQRLASAYASEASARNSMASAAATDALLPKREALIDSQIGRNNRYTGRSNLAGGGGKPYSLGNGLMVDENGKTVSIDDKAKELGVTPKVKATDLLNTQTKLFSMNSKENSNYTPQDAERDARVQLDMDSVVTYETFQSDAFKPQVGKTVVVDEQGVGYKIEDDGTGSPVAVKLPYNYLKYATPTANNFEARMAAAKQSGEPIVDADGATWVWDDLSLEWKEK